MSRLVITASPLIARWSITSPTRRDRVSWPPSPDTLFGALVAAAASLGEPCHPALYWLETLGNPAIGADLDPPVVEGIVHFSPVADRSPWERRHRKGRWHNSVSHPGPVAWSWKIDTREHIDAIRRIASEITYIGSSRAPVLATAQVSNDLPPRGALVPDEGGRYRIRGIYPGRLDELEAAFQRGQRPRPSQTVGYARVGEERLVSPWGQMIPLRRATGQRLHISHSVPITEAVRLALTRHLPDRASGMLTGHTAGGSVLTSEHMAIVPLARIDEHGGDRFADGDVLGVGLLLPASCSDDDYELLISGLQRWLTAGGHVVIGANRWAMEVAHNDHRRTLQPSRLSGFSQTWTTATPVVCDRHPRRDLSLQEVIAGMCRDVGLPAPRDVEATPYGRLGGCADSRRHSLGQRSYLRRSYVTHVRVTWPRRVPGPILLGRGRYFGLGAMLPHRGTA
jgi:CRISPR-associated protein Csb2